MKTILITLMTTFAATVYASDPFTNLTTRGISEVQVGDVTYDWHPLSEGGLHSESDSPKIGFDVYFTITNRATIGKLVRRLNALDRSLGHIPMCGMLSSQRWFDREGGLVGETRVINFANTVALNAPGFPTNPPAFEAGTSPSFCRAIYDLMLTNCPERVDALREFHREVGGRSLEAMLFDGNQAPGTAQQTPAGDALKAAPEE